MRKIHIEEKKSIFNTGFSQIVLFLALSVFTTEIYAQGNLLVTPRRVMLDKTNKVQELNLANTGKDTATYIISLQEIKMNEDGKFEEITAPEAGQNSASGYIKFFPKTLTLAPNEAQTIKVQMIKPAQIAEGEYRSHIYFRAVPQNSAADAVTDPSEISVSLTPVFGITIPVIVRSGTLDANVELVNPTLSKDSNTQKLSFSFSRTGNMSVYGDISVDHIAADGKITRVKSVNGIAVYTPNTTRRVIMDLGNHRGVDYSAGKLLVAYTTQQNNNSITLAKTELDLK